MIIVVIRIKLNTRLVYILHTESRVSKLSAGYIGIHSGKQVITHSAPCLIDADLQTSLVCQCPTHKPQLTIVTEYCAKV